MKKAAEKSAVRWICAFLAALFFLGATGAASLRRMQRTYGCAADDTAGQNTCISGLFDLYVSDLADALRVYFESSGQVRIACPQQFRQENTNFRFTAFDSDGVVILQTAGDDEEYRYTETRTLPVEVSSTASDRLLRREEVTIECALCADLQADDMFSRALLLLRTGAALEDALWSAFVVCAAAALAFSLPALLSAAREAKRPKGADRLFNAVPADLYVCCTLPALAFFVKMLRDGVDESELLRVWVRTGSGAYRFLLRPSCAAGVFLLALIFAMLTVYALRRGGWRRLFAITRFVRAPFPRRSLLYLVCMQLVKCLAILLYLTAYTRGVILFLLLEKAVTLPVVYRLLRQLRALMDQTAQFVQGDLSGAAARDGDFETLRAHGADVDSIVGRISASANEYAQSSRFRAELITNLSHDIKTPLTSIISYAQLLRREDLTPQERARYLDVLQRQSGRLQKLVEDLGEVSDAASGNVRVQPQRLDLCALIGQSAAGFEERLQKQNVSICFRFPEKPVFVTADPRLLQRVADNLMNNICKYTRSGTQVQIAVMEGDASVAAVFRNRSAQKLTLSGDALMERFVRADDARHTDGSGLGLSIAQQLCQLQGCRLTLHTEDDWFTAQILFRTDGKEA